MALAETTVQDRVRLQRTLPFDGADRVGSAGPRGTVGRSGAAGRLGVVGLPARRRLVLAELNAPGRALGAAAPGAVKPDRIGLPAVVAPVLQVLGAGFVFAVCLMAAAYL